MLGRGICEKYQSRNEKFPEPKGEGNLVSRLVDQHALDFSSASSLKQQSADRHVAPLGHIILIPSGEATNTNRGLNPRSTTLITPPMRYIYIYI